MSDSLVRLELPPDIRRPLYVRCTAVPRAEYCSTLHRALVMRAIEGTLRPAAALLTLAVQNQDLTHSSHP